MNSYFTYPLTLSLTLLTACAGLDTKLPEVSETAWASEVVRQENDVLNKRSQDEARLLNVGWDIFRANPDLCPHIHPSIGVKLHQIDAYPKRLRPAAERVLGAKAEPSVLHIAKGSPAEMAGILPGDVFVTPQNEPLKPNSKSWQAALKSGHISVRRNGEVLALPITTKPSCDYKLKLSESSDINAYANGRDITLTTAMMDFLKTDDELALIIGHELAHNTMGHVRKVLGNYILSLGGTRFTRDFESEADYVGLYYIARAGYSLDDVENVWRRLALKSPKNIGRAKTHPTFPERYLRIQASRDEILAKQKDLESKNYGHDFTPNFKPDT